MKIVFFGSSHLVIPILEVLNKNFDLALVVTTEKKVTDAVPAFCKTNDIPYTSVSSLQDILDTKYQILNTKSPVAILASFGVIVPQELIDIFPKGIVNIHPSFLPEYRGPTPIQQAMLDGKKETAVSIMLLDQEVDHGPLLAQIPLEIKPTDTAESLYLEAFKLGAEKLVEILPAYVANNIEPREQDHSKATYTPRDLTRESGFIDLDQTKNMSSSEIENWKLKIARMIRAYYPWPGVWTKVTVNGQEKVLKLLPNTNRHPELALAPYRPAPRWVQYRDASHGASRSGTGVSASQSDNILFQMEGKKPVSKKDLLNGYPELKEIIEKIS